jgi:hypothetical protein
MHWKNWLEDIEEQDIWKAGKFAKNPISDSGHSLIPTLHKKNSENNIIRNTAATLNHSQD